jgi:hypothetical protein
MKCCSVRFLILVALSVFCLVLAAPARADLVITGDNTTVAPNGTGTASFFLTSNGGDYNLSTVSLQLVVSVVSGSSTLQFTDANTSFTSFTNQPNYVFFGDSFVQMNSSNYWNSPSNTPNGSIFGGDFTNDGHDITVTPSTPPLLLAEVQYMSVLGASPGDSFQIQVDPTSDPTGSGVGPTQLSDSSGDFQPYTSTPATVTVALAVTPEPSSLLLAGMGSLTGLLHFWRSRRKVRTVQLACAQE